MKANKNKLIPDLRFPEFKNDGEWKQEVLENITSAIFDGTHQTPTYTESGIPFFSVENIISGSKNKFISKKDYLIETAVNKPEQGDILITRIGNIGFSVLIDWDYDFSIYVTLACIKQSANFNSQYLHSFFQSDTYQKEILSKSLLNAAPRKINMNELRGTRVLLPNTLEQQKIASCLSSLDKIITSQTEKLELLQNHKKGLMQNLFPQDGEKVPKYRFPEFLEDGYWQEKKLSELGGLVNGLTYSPDDIREEGILVLRSSNVQNGQIDLNDCVFVDENVKGVNPTLKGDILVCIRNGSKSLIGKNAIINVEMPFTTHGAFMTIFRAVNPQFIFQLFQSSFYFKQVNADLGATINSINGNNFLKYKFFVPNQLEQDRIASCLSFLDNLITSQTGKIEQLELHKKGLMQGLFPKII